jgi:hypothetical protein
MSLSATEQRKLTQLRYEHAALAFQFALIKLELAYDRWLEHFVIGWNRFRIPKSVLF